MTKVRVYELAKELKITSKELIEKVADLNLDINSHMSTVEKEEADLIKELLRTESDSEINNSKNTSNAEKEDKDMEEKNENGVIEIEENIIVKDLAEKLEVTPSEVITKLISLGIMANQNQSVDFDTASIIAEEFGISIKKSSVEEDDEEIGFHLDFEDDPKDLKPRPPIVTVMGHVDHGKTSLLDAIRKTAVTEREAGGITQHIGASTINIDGEKIVFLDTPGHEAFTTMRARGAQVTDIAILVVAADDGVMPQTVEAINHAKAANVPIIVAINKMDKPAANPDRIKQELVEYGLVPEDWGGDTICVPVSARNEEGIDDVLEMILLVAEMQELKANPNRKAVGIIVEAELDKGRGPVATVLVQKGTLKVGDIVVSGTAHGRVRAMLNDKGKRVKKATPSIPVMILGLSEVPEAGEHLYVVENEKKARNYTQARKEKIREEQLKSSQKVSLDDLFEKIQLGEVKELNVIIKADVKGSVEAVKQSLSKLETDEVRVNVIHGGVGGITESDVMLASASNAIIIGFNVRPTLTAIDISKRESVDIRTYRVIYDAIEDIESAMRGLLDPTIEEEVIGRAEIRATFKVPNVGMVAGIYVLQGKITRNSKIRLLREDVVIYEGDISSLKRFKDDAKEIQSGYEGGLSLENYNDIKEGDIIEAYILKEVER
ncbi:translation initiation factor IF-2 [Anaerosalibacter bizertensis]|uniref:Translation initiation factor IF-2 n=1 Tax=Anaerosalibacter bizertensis TaxID=932217 RepID=A0A9Q4ABK9_9FIRM|nr:translation initiation factor IF-2 [Anaerosalibacter bizertensis]MBV1818565.1 translation initiation factor IF-2 [Bacteroidales bacterium MSK.15.36]HHV27275.1 translation initiation factor IF-2 [Tissierellia bacterium]MCB5558779.1 translation initiation factor IF-2 [Anaerosalibacter bizertensis]MCG4564611.1 translation initiation factor IF-2 [Anaerosalibacter bizertensis]MCG4582267.1 translation initiation factor IF-2 [Anaerosalibacter bizertensis]